LKQELRKRGPTELASQRTSYDHVKSILKKELSRKILGVPDKHRSDNFFLDLANLKIVDKLMRIKSQFNFRNENSNPASRYSAKRLATTEDYS
jgi:hypothetical protein